MRPEGAIDAISKLISISPEHAAQTEQQLNCQSDIYGRKPCCAENLSVIKRNGFKETWAFQIQINDVPGIHLMRFGCGHYCLVTLRMTGMNVTLKRSIMGWVSSRKQKKADIWFDLSTFQMLLEDSYVSIQRSSKVNTPLCRLSFSNFILYLCS